MLFLTVNFFHAVCANEEEIFLRIVTSEPVEEPCAVQAAINGQDPTEFCESERRALRGNDGRNLMCYAPGGYECCRLCDGFVVNRCFVVYKKCINFSRAACCNRRMEEEHTASKVGVTQYRELSNAVCEQEREVTMEHLEHARLLFKDSMALEDARVDCMLDVVVNENFDSASTPPN